MTGIEGLSHAGQNGNAFEQVAGMPVRMVGKSLEGFSNVAVNRKTRGILGSIVDAGLVIPFQVGKEVIFTPIGAAGSILKGTRDAAMNVLKPTASIAMHGMAELIQIPLPGVDIRNASPARLTRIESAVSGGQTLQQAIESTRRRGPDEGQNTANPNPQPQPTVPPTPAP